MVRVYLDKDVELNRLKKKELQQLMNKMDDHQIRKSWQSHQKDLRPRIVVTPL